MASASRTAGIVSASIMGRVPSVPLRCGIGTRAGLGQCRARVNQFSSDAERPRQPVDHWGCGLTWRTRNGAVTSAVPSALTRERPTLTGAGGSDPFWHLASGYSWAGWSDYAARNGIVCTPGTVIKGGDGILYPCQ